MSNLINITRIKAVARMLAVLRQDIVFVGGATVALYADATAAEARPTEDVDVVVELASYSGYAALDEQLRGAGFKNDLDSGVICRYQMQGIIVDVMPTEPEVIGFSNRWYREGFQQAETRQLDDLEIKLFTLPYFIASKMEAFKSRGKSDYRYSSDFEDIVFVFENNSRVEALILAAPSTVRNYLANEFLHLLKDPNLEEGLYVHLEPRNAPQAIVGIEKMLKNIANSVH